MCGGPGGASFCVSLSQRLLGLGRLQARWAQVSVQGGCVASSKEVLAEPAEGGSPGGSPGEGGQGTGPGCVPGAVTGCRRAGGLRGSAGLSVSPSEYSLQGRTVCGQGGTAALCCGAESPERT